MKTIQEKRGYVNGLENFTNYVLNYLENICNRLISNEKIKNPDLKFDNRTILKNVFKRHIMQYGEDNFRNIVQPIKINKQILEQLGVYGIDTFVIDIYANLDSGGFFNQYDSSLKSDGKGWNEIAISLNIIPYIFVNKADVASTIQHEMTHAYEYARQVKNKGSEWTEYNTQNKYYKTSLDDDDTINMMSYIFSQSERNAVISSLYTYLKYNNATKDNYIDIINNSDYAIMLKKMESVSNMIKNNSNNIVNNIIEWIKNNPEHVDMFPSIKNKSFVRYQKRLLMAINSVINKFKIKGNRIIQYYLNNKATN